MPTKQTVYFNKQNQYMHISSIGYRLGKPSFEYNILGLLCYKLVVDHNIDHRLRFKALAEAGLQAYVKSYIA